MTAQFIRINNIIINLQLITSVHYTARTATEQAITQIFFDFENSDILRGNDAETFWKALQCSSLNLTPRSPQLSVWDAAK